MNQEKNTSSSAAKPDFARYFVDYWGYITLGLAAAILAAGFFLFLKPAYEKMNSNAEIESLNNQLDEMYRSIRKIDEMNEAYAQISEEDKKKIFNMLPDQQNAESIFPIIETLVSKNGLLPVSLKINEVKKAAGRTQAQLEGGEALQAAGPASAAAEESLPPEIVKLKILLTVSGADYQGVKNLLKSFENSLRLMDVVKIDFEGSDETLFEIVTYYVKK